ncbi:MAG: Rrf2 family transcriptional regulator [Thermoguttaceae bacterium]|nr:Rrf2 family transcriptional regulator [Thermoguttaceae bacterium]
MPSTNTKTIIPDWPIAATRPSARIEGAALAVYELALERPTGRPTAARQIAEKYGLSERFLTQILQRLRRRGIVETTRGAFGGFRLLIDPAELTLGFVLTAVETPAPPANSTESDAKASKKAFGKDGETDKRRKTVSANVESAAAQATRLLFDRVWTDAEAKRQEFLNEIRFSDLIAARPSEPANFAI